MKLNYSKTLSLLITTFVISLKFCHFIFTIFKLSSTLIFSMTSCKYLDAILAFSGCSSPRTGEIMKNGHLVSDIIVIVFIVLKTRYSYIISS